MCFEAAAFRKIASTILLNGREIFQKERVDKGYREPATELTQQSGN
jgi:hypothetical protein